MEGFYEKLLQNGTAPAVFDHVITIAIVGETPQPTSPAIDPPAFRLSSRSPSASARRHRERTTEFKDGYRLRNGIEATNSEYKRAYGGGRLRLRGSRPVARTVKFKFMALSIRRRVKPARKTQNQAAYGLCHSFGIPPAPARLEATTNRPIASTPHLRPASPRHHSHTRLR
ncbi:MAG: transposase [Planctomycetes bacterium]|nr:transposase [Planctomycetota bacterium]